MQGGFYTLARQVVSSAERDGQFDLVVATSMLDLARFAGVARKALGGAPLVLYMHENQLTYPVAPRDDFDMTYALINWSAMAAADLVLFNSAFHLREWFEALPRLLRRLPDERHNGLIPDVAKRCEVQPAGVDLGRFDVSDAIRGERPLILWNQRWDHDKDPDLFATAMSEAAQSGLEFDLALAGEQFVSNPPAFEELRVTFGERIVHYGQADHSSYVDLLRRADVVVSTARQEFFGIAITEAVYAGSVSLVTQCSRLSRANSREAPFDLSIRRPGRSLDQAHLGTDPSRTGAVRCRVAPPGYGAIRLECGRPSTRQAFRSSEG